ncbi:MAG: alpha-amylase family glycosyl hydrolase [bacterium]
MQCYFKDENTVLLELDYDVEYEIYEEEQLLISSKYSEITELYIKYNIGSNYYIKIGLDLIELDYNGIYDTDEFSKYNTDEILGMSISNDISFKLWAPLKKKIDLIISNDSIEFIFPMKKENGVFKANIDISYIGYYYHYRIYNINNVIDSVDPYAKCVINNKGYIIDTSNNKQLNRNIKDSQRIIYELHILDYTNECINKGKFLGLVEKETLNHLVELGVTDIQLLPIFDFEHDDTYTWGYMPLNYNSLTSLYAVDEHNKISEFQNVVNILHQNNIGVIMDVVYNHTSFKHCFNNFVPKYFYRMKDNIYCNASGCGNEISSERYMTRKYIVDSVIYQINTYGLSGLRFDLMAILDIETINTISKEVKEINDEIILYGEPWSCLKPNIKIEFSCNNYNKFNAYIFNDILRDSIKGNVFNKYDKGFIQGNNYYKNIILTELNKQTINYVSCHDNLTLYDKLSLTSDYILDMQKQANAIVILSSGITFLHSGVEMCRTKKLNDNSYNSPIEINKINWNNKYEYNECFEYYKNIISFKKKMDIINLSEYETNIDSILSYKINDYIIIHNGNEYNYLSLQNHTLLFHKIECNIYIDELYLEKNNTYIIKKN